MCQILVTKLGCGHQIRGPILQCPFASRTGSRDPRRDNGRSLLCPEMQPLDVRNNTCCEQCFASIFRDFLRTICQPCRRLSALNMGRSLIEMVERAAKQANGGNRSNCDQIRSLEVRLWRSEQNTERLRRDCQEAETQCLAARAACEQARRACQIASQKSRKDHHGLEERRSELRDPTPHHWH